VLLRGEGFKVSRFQGFKVSRFQGFGVSRLQRITPMLPGLFAVLETLKL
jgi:hypothetical protein